MTNKIKSDYAVTLNALADMQQSAAYAIRKQVLIDAENIIISLENKLKAKLSCNSKIEGDLLPPVDSKVEIHLASCDKWVQHTVTGYYVWGDLDHQDQLHRVFVRVVDNDGIPNVRLLRDVKLIAPISGETEEQSVGPINNTHTILLSEKQLEQIWDDLFPHKDKLSYDNESFARAIERAVMESNEKIVDRNLYSTDQFIQPRGDNVVAYYLPSTDMYHERVTLDEKTARHWSAHMGVKIIELKPTDSMQSCKENHMMLNPSGTCDCGFTDPRPKIAPIDSSNADGMLFELDWVCHEGKLLKVHHMKDNSVFFYDTTCARQKLLCIDHHVFVRDAYIKM